MKRDPFDFEKIRLSDGGTIFYQKARDEESVFRFLLKAGGSRYDKPGLEGCAHLLEHLLGGKTKGYGSIEFRDFILKNLIRVVASTSMESIWIKATCPEGKISKLMPLIKDKLIFNGNQLSEEQIRREKRVIEQEMPPDKRDMSLFQVQQEVSSTLFHDHRFSRGVNSLGTVDSLSEIEKKDLVKHYSKFFIPSNFYVVAITRLSKSEVKKLVSNLSLPEGEKLEYPEPLSFSPAPRKNLIIHRLSDLLEGKKIEIGETVEMFSVIVKEDMNMPWSLITRTLEEGLERDLRAKHSLVYSVDVSTTEHRDMIKLSLFARVPEGKSKETRSKILEKIDKFDQFEDLFEKFKKKKIYDLRTSKPSPHRIANEARAEISLYDNPTSLSDAIRSVEEVDFNQARTLVEKWLNKDRILTHFIIP